LFYVGLLKKFHGEAPTAPGTLPPIRHGRACPTPASVLQNRMATGQRELLVQWVSLAAADASWVLFVEFQKMYPTFQLEDELVQQDRRDVMVGLQYHRQQGSSAMENRGEMPGMPA
jgi:hypothetical protein